ncbi:hypothetical protein [Streptomyces sp. AK010]|uniref:hypothetical protein n=1 Tax=Streptomyces sp. AK010 TaxID=2723074 RepID=UPI0017F8EFA5|nr:hypothetical protein [Streptomyces sp. AK010]MBB6418089.1 hypothetical protein [Streptomyces sp. AK010]
MPDSRGRIDMRLRRVRRLTATLAVSKLLANTTNFQDGNAGMYLTGPYNISTFDTALGKDKYEVLPAPSGPAGNNDVLADGGNISFGARTGKTKQEQTLAAFLVSPEGQELAMTGDHQPVVRIPVNSALDAAKVRHGPAGAWCRRRTRPPPRSSRRRIPVSTSKSFPAAPAPSRP